MREQAISFTPYLYRYHSGGATALAAAEALDVDALRVAKTLVFESESRDPLVVIMNGRYQTSVKALARELAKKSIAPCSASRAESLTGYRVGGISPFGQRTAMPVYMQIDLFEFETIWVNGGQRGFMIEVAPGAIEQALAARLVDVAIGPPA